jgi:hypothetical protein
LGIAEFSRQRSVARLHTTAQGAAGRHITIWYCAGAEFEVAFVRLQRALLACACIAAAMHHLFLSRHTAGCMLCSFNVALLLLLKQPVMVTALL